MFAAGDGARELDGCTLRQLRLLLKNGRQTTKQSVALAVSEYAQQGKEAAGLVMRVSSLQAQMEAEGACN